ncbi:MaoC family dehydratase [Halorientalis marina]|uniref:MaoC family dehydratase n=1 Tax=Halorientalis marina TaxID=2931976 RepID=UPI001FF4604D|nr:MaoC family dehydratase [Halorientalis marina]
MSDDRPYFEDIDIGETRSFGDYHVTEAEVLEFAEQYDPQPFHTDEEAARESMFGGLVASGWHTAAMTMRMLVDNYLNESRALGAVGVDELRWSQPVRPDETLSVETEVVDKEPWGDAQGMGVVHSRARTTNQEDTTKMTFVGLLLFPMADP